ncbi:hypothetical protein EV202_10650 [Bacteroides heparinolyticus]|uniref:Uncharacterized protein n=1 Tax=Prevotella heparinolytica TaxID=28113 RepID=A0A4R2LM91_9BACE|nr:hypothetical protein EV202_10650 [Bacteroides heparinolyticus]
MVNYSKYQKKQYCWHLSVFVFNFESSQNYLRSLRKQVALSTEISGTVVQPSPSVGCNRPTYFCT